MSDDKLEEISDSINLQMIAEQNVVYRNKYSPILTEEIDLYNAVIKYKEVINKAINYIEENKQHEYRNGNFNEYYLELNEKEMTELLDILKEVKDK